MYNGVCRITYENLDGIMETIQTNKAYLTKRTALLRIKKIMKNYPASMFDCKVYYEFCTKLV